MHLFSSFSSFIRKYFKHPKILSLLEFPVLFLGAMPNETPALYSLMNYADIQLGTWYPMKGMHEFIKTFARIRRMLKLPKDAWGMALYDALLASGERTMPVRVRQMCKELSKQRARRAEMPKGRCIQPFHAEQGGEMSLAVGDIVLVTDQGSDGWWEGTCGKRKGLFPGNFVKLEAQTGGGSASVTANGTADSGKVEGDQDDVNGGGDAFNIVEPVDGFHPSQAGNQLLAESVWDDLAANRPAWLPAANPYNAEIVALCELTTPEQEALLKPLLEAHLLATGSAKAGAILADWGHWKSRFKLLVPPSELATVGFAPRQAVAV
jgi:hypothetical protein